MKEAIRVHVANVAQHVPRSTRAYIVCIHVCMCVCVCERCVPNVACNFTYYYSITRIEHALLIAYAYAFALPLSLSHSLFLSLSLYIFPVYIRMYRCVCLCVARVSMRFFARYC